MVTVQRFDSFSGVKDAWQALEDSNGHYPFQAWWYQQLFATEFCNPADVHLLGIYDDQILIAAGGFERINNTILFLGMKQVLGGQDLTDYGDILISNSLQESKVTTQDIWQAIIRYFQDKNIKHLQLDFVREDSKTFSAFHKNHGYSEEVSFSITKQEVSPYIVLPISWNDYLMQLSRVERHDLKRKIRRLKTQMTYHFCTKETITQDFEDFISLHRLSDPKKEKFMSEEMKAFFWKLFTAEKKTYEAHLCFLHIDDKRVASVMTFTGKEKVLVYNSGFDPNYGYYSVGLLLHAYLIKKSIQTGKKIHDFLRGAERFKYDLGAKDMQLYKIAMAL